MGLSKPKFIGLVGTQGFRQWSFLRETEKKPSERESEMRPKQALGWCEYSRGLVGRLYWSLLLRWIRNKATQGLRWKEVGAAQGDEREARKISKHALGSCHPWNTPKRWMKMEKREGWDDEGSLRPKTKVAANFVYSQLMFFANFGRNFGGQAATKRGETKAKITLLREVNATAKTVHPYTKRRSP